MWICLLVGGVLACAVSPASASAPERLEAAVADPDGAFVPGEAIVRFEPGTSAALQRAAREAAGVELEDTMGLPRAQLVDVEGAVGAAVRRLERQPGVAYAQPNYRYGAAVVSEDTFSEELWGLGDPVLPDPGVSVSGAWQGSRGADQVIAVLDTGVDLTHPDIAPNLWIGPGPDEHGFDFVDDDPDPDDYGFHGTHVAGTAAAVADNHLGIAGVAPEAEIMAVRVLDGDGSGATDDLVAGIDYAADHGADVINMSLSGPAGGGDQAVFEAIEAAGSADVAVVVAAGNEGADNDAEPHVPCVLPNANLICVAALDRNSGSLASFSNYGAESVDIAAPGTSVLSARTDYEPIFSEGFEPGFGGWSALAEGSSVPWGESSLSSAGSGSATDSPGVDYEPGSDSQLIKSTPLDLSAERGCRMHFDLLHDIQPPTAAGILLDRFLAGALVDGGEQDVKPFAGSSEGVFRPAEVSIADLDGEAEVHPAFALFSDATQQFDGAYVDRLRLLCRSESYSDEPPPLGNYVSFQGTSMAAPHVAGEVALVRAAAPGLSAEEAVQAVLEGASAIPVFAPGRRTATEGIADACKAVALATGAEVGAGCAASSDPVPQPASGGGTQPLPSIPVAPDTQTPNPEAAGRASGSDRVPPHTFLRRRPARVVAAFRGRARAVFRFGSNERGARFLCWVDRGRFGDCPTRLVLRVGPGRHVLRVKARDAAGNTDRTPVVYRFEVERAD